MKQGLRIGIIWIAALIGIGCSVHTNQVGFKALLSDTGSIQITLPEALSARHTQSRLDDISRIDFRVQCARPLADADASRSLYFNGGSPIATGSVSVSFGKVWPGDATVSATIYGTNGIRTTGYRIQDLQIGTTLATVSVVAGATASVPLNIKMADTQTQAGGLTISLGIQEGDENLIPLAYQVTTLAGSGSSAPFADGATSSASFNKPFDVAVDATGNVYVADWNNNRIRKITPAGVVSTLAGSTYGFADGTGASAQFRQPYGVAVDAAGNVYVADTGNQRIRKITSAGVVSTLAGSGTIGWLDDATSSAKFDMPDGVAVDAAGNVYVAEWNNNRIRKITPGGVVSTLAGSGAYGYADGPAATASFRRFKGLGVDAAGNVYVADAGNHRIRKIDTAGNVSTLAGSTIGFADGTGASAQFNQPHGLAVDAAGNIYVADLYNHRIRKITPAGKVTTIAGSGAAGHAEGTGASAQFNEPYGVAVDAAGNVYVADTGNNRIRKLSY